MTLSNQTSRCICNALESSFVVAPINCVWCVYGLEVLTSKFVIEFFVTFLCLERERERDRQTKRERERVTEEVRVCLI